MKKILIAIIASTLILTFYFNSKEERIVSKSHFEKSFSQRKGYVKGVLKKDSPNLFAEYYSKITTEIGKDKSGYPPNYRFDELKKAERNSSLSKKENLNWISRGPSNVGGRARGIIIDPDDVTRNTWFVAAVGGGVWKTTDAGVTWRDLTSGMSNLSASYMAMDPSNHNILYLGTGEGFGNLDALGGQGIWKSTDRGESWKPLTYTTNNAVFFGLVNRIIIDPNDSNILLAVSSSSNYSSSKQSRIWRSVDAGETWSYVYSSVKDIQQIIYNPSNFDIQYATVNGEGVIKSTDAGKTWKASSNGMTAPSRIEIAISSINPKRLYASVASGKSSVYVSSDSGASWKQCVTSEDFLGGQGWYDNAIIVDPNDENIFYVAGVNIYRVKYIGGTSVEVTKLTDNYGSDPALHKGTHVDNHFFAVAKFANSSDYRLVCSNDGGVCFTDDKGETFKQPTTGFITSQFYGVDKANGKDLYIGGMQDNSCYASPLNTSDKDAWRFVFGGDGFDVIWNYDDENKVMLTSQYNNIAITHSGIDNANNSGWLADVDGGDGNAPFFTKLAGSKQFTDLVFTFGKSGIWRTDDFGITWNSIAMPEEFKGTESISEVKISLANPKVVWAGSSLHPASIVSVSTDYGMSFEKVSSVDNVLTFLSGFATHPTDENTAYALFSAANNAKVWRTTDLGKTWEDISGFNRFGSSTNNFPDVAVFDLLVIPNTSTIWVGTEIGIFESTDDGATWHRANNGLPPVSVYDLLIVNDEVVVGTHGRGVWTVSLPELSDYEPVSVLLPPSASTQTVIEDGKQVSNIKISFRSNYESVKVYMNDVLLKEYNNVISGDEVNLKGELKSGENVLKTISVLNGETIEYKTQIFAIPYKAPANGYANNFNNSSSIRNDFYGEGFDISQPIGFENKAINSEHPHATGSDIIIYLTIPIIVDKDHPEIKYKDVAIVEPGESGTAYPDEQFWDYVTVEGSLDGENWVPMVAPYDATLNSSWNMLFNNGFKPSKTNYVEHVSSTTDYFNDGDIIYIRFRLFSDAYTAGWGWIIDDLEIQQGALSIDDNYLSTQFKVYPNPIVDETLYLESTTESRITNIKLYNLSGQLLLSTDFANVDKAKINVSSFAKGQYLLKVETSNGAFSKKLMIK